MKWIVFACLAAGVATAQTGAPSFTAADVLPANSRTAEALRPGMIVSIYGRQLGPQTGCTADQRAWDGARDLCGVSVTIAGVPAGLLYAQQAQINLRVPFSTPTEGMLPFAVTYQGRSSAAVPVRFAVLTARISFDAPVYVHMPAWIRIDLPDPQQHSLRYPVSVTPAAFGGHHFEVRRNGVVLPQNAIPNGALDCCGGPAGVGMIGGGTLLGLPHEPKDRTRLPLHLLYRFDQPGNYEVRYTGVEGPLGKVDRALARSAWLPFEVQPFPEARRTAWLAQMKRTAPSDAVDLVSDYLPSLLAVPDGAALAILEDSVYHPDSLVRSYARNALQAFEDALLEPWVRELIARRGPTEELAYLLSWRRTLFQPHGADIVRSSLRHVGSPNTMLSAGALQTLYFLKWQYDWKARPEIYAQMDQEVRDRFTSLMSTRRREVLQPLALYLGVTKTEWSRTLLQKLVDDGTVREQALICLKWTRE